MQIKRFFLFLNNIRLIWSVLSAFTMRPLAFRYGKKNRNALHRYGYKRARPHKY